MCCVYAREFVREKKYKTEAEAFGWSFVFEDFVSEELKKKVTQKLEVNLNPMGMSFSDGDGGGIPDLFGLNGIKP